MTFKRLKLLQLYLFMFKFKSIAVTYPLVPTFYHADLQLDSPLHRSAVVKDGNQTQTYGKGYYSTLGLAEACTTMKQFFPV